LHTHNGGESTEHLREVIVPAKVSPYHRGASAARKFATMTLLACQLAACASAGGIGSDVQIAGDEKGGKIVGGVREGGTRPAMTAVTAHCVKYNKKAFVTQMEAPAQGGALAFVCL
jgi:predicted small secreted protein